MMMHVAMGMIIRAILMTTYMTTKKMTSLVERGTQMTTHVAMTMTVSLVKRSVQMMACVTMTMMMSLAKRRKFPFLRVSMPCRSKTIILTLFLGCRMGKASKFTIERSSKEA